MVHALSEIHRVLVPGGVLIDLRPLLDEWPLEVTSRNRVREAGHATDLAEPLADDVAANQAIEEGIRQGWFQREEGQEFPFFYYWDTPKEMQEYLDDSWEDVIHIEEQVWRTLRALWAIAEADARVRIKIKMSIASLRRQNPG